MSLEEQRPVPAANDDPLILAGLEIAAKWGAALGGPEKLEVALRALEPQLKREHQIRLKQLENQRAQAERDAAAEREASQREAEAAKAASERAAREAERMRKHTYRMCTLGASVLIALAMLGGGIWIAPDQPWLATALCGPSLLALVKLFLTQRSDAADMKAVGRAARAASSAVSPPPP
ncbi:hypothetical protein AB0N14_17885 [Streptomyces sp. NPDC051104]|uniref:hypothetical protein n=1 Tax=Streptomyces sp. NPDC051104 TaxID=3155044 RepID=UPI00342E1B6E